MHSVPAFNPAIRVHRHDGEIYGPYHSLQDLASVLTPTTARLFGRRINDPTSCFGDPARFIARTELGDVLDPDTIFGAYLSLVRVHRARGVPATTFRNGPVPRTGKRPGTSGRRRRIHTQAERRHYDAAMDDDGNPIVVRGSRSPANLPTFYDDIGRHRDRCWKTHRPHQWKDAS